jgi:hypothetical protein
MMYAWREKGGLDARYNMQITGRIIAQSRLKEKGEERHGNQAAPKQLLDRRTKMLAILQRPPTTAG